MAAARISASKRVLLAPTTHHRLRAGHFAWPRRKRGVFAPNAEKSERRTP
nr:MAG TPA: hypothetical protein [Caudoviricetes sp.]